MTRLSELQPDLVPSSSRSGGLAKVVVFLGDGMVRPAPHSGNLAHGPLRSGGIGTPILALPRPKGERGGPSHLPGGPQPGEAAGVELTLVRNQELRCGETGEARRSCEDARASAAEVPRRTRDFVLRAGWLRDRSPQATLRDVEGLAKRVDRAETAGHECSLTSGRPVGVPREEDEDFDSGEVLQSIHIDLVRLNEEATGLAARSARYLEVLGT